MKLLAITSILMAGTPALVYAQAMRAVTSTPGPGLHVVATWPPDPVILRYNLYRRNMGQASFPTTPLNAQPIARMASCLAIQSVIPPGSEDWTLLAKGLADSPTVDFDPCLISTITPGSPKNNKLIALARTRWRIAVAAGLAFNDTTVVSGTAYQYELRGVNAVGAETGVVFTGVGVTAGSPTPIPAPPGLSATAGDHRVLLLWGNQPEAAGFIVRRATNVIGPYTRVNESTMILQIKQDLNGVNLTTPSNGFLDIARWDSAGQPATHTVVGTPIAGPSNGATYFYRVASVDLLGQTGPLSSPSTPSTPQDRTPPAAPGGVQVTAIDSQNRLEIRWNKVEFDADGHAESAALAGYKVYRYDNENAPLASGVQVGGVIASPPAGLTYVAASDNSPVLRPPFGEKTFWYRVEGTDASGNVGARSAAIGAHLKDITPPAPPVGLQAEGFDDFIRLRWNANKEPDLDGYQIYRSLCHNGRANPCDRPEPDQSPGINPDATGAFVAAAGGSVPCTGSYVLIGTVSLADALKMAATVTFEDRTIPKGSPLCYSYWIKAIDKAQNRSGAWPVPNPATETTVCQRLRDKTPPEAAIISGLFARDGAVRVEWIGPPVQDIRAYHVYRADKEPGPYKWVGGMTVEPPPASPVILTKPYQAPPMVDCKTIPIVSITSMSMGFFVDRIEPKTVQWYKVVGIDQSGNEAPLAQAIPVSTFTFSTALPPAPAIGSITGTTSAPLGLVVRWNPLFDASQHQGFAVFRSDSSTGLFRQVGTLLQGSEYQDNQVVRGVSYWYKVVQMDRSGQVSLPSPAVSGSLP
jgi:hypothetical protein